jgi:DNA-binding MarR family transcriptional regulator
MNKQTIQEELMNLAYQIARQMRKQMGGVGDDKLHDKVSVYQLHAMFHIAKHVATMSELAEEMNISLPSATSLVDRLVKSGWVERQADPDDRRIIRLAITEEGRKVCMAMKAERMRTYKFLLDAMSEEDLQSLHRIFTNLHASLAADKTKKVASR